MSFLTRLKNELRWIWGKIWPWVMGGIVIVVTLVMIRGISLSAKQSQDSPQHELSEGCPCSDLLNDKFEDMDKRICDVDAKTAEALQKLDLILAWVSEPQNNNAKIQELEQGQEEHAEVLRKLESELHMIIRRHPHGCRGGNCR